MLLSLRADVSKQEHEKHTITRGILKGPDQKKIKNKKNKLVGLGGSNTRAIAHHHK